MEKKYHYESMTYGTLLENNGVHTSEQQQSANNLFNGKTNTSSYEDLEDLSPRKAPNTEDTSEGFRQSIVNENDKEQDLYQTKKPERKIIRAKLIND
jgi:hypothetical protein